VSNDETAALMTTRKPENYVWPLLSLVVVILPQVLIPARLRLGPVIYVPIVEGLMVLLLLLIAAKPGPVPRSARPIVLTLFFVLIGANTAAAARLVVAVMQGTPPDKVAPTATRLLIATGLVLATNVVTFALVYWQIDGGGPFGRLSENPPYPDFQFPQTGTEGLAPPDWTPRYGDYLYVSCTNIVAFSPTDTLPLTGRAKALMGLQSFISLAVLVVVLARVINLLPA
jgi:uncharacterized membrane protein